LVGFEVTLYGRFWVTPKGLEPEFSRCVVLKRGTDEFVVRLNAPEYDVFSPLVKYQIVDRSADLTKERRVSVYREFLAVALPDMR
jgi:hypothetical protein